MADLGIQKRDEDLQKIYHRYCADSRFESNRVSLGALLDLSKFNSDWDFSKNFRISAALSFRTSHLYTYPLFSLLSPEVTHENQLSLFECSQRLVSSKQFLSQEVPRRLGGSRLEKSPYVRAAERLEKRNKVLVLDGLIEFENENSSTSVNNGFEGLISIYVYLPKYEILGSKLAKFF